MTFRVLIVCTANICRSPLAELLLRSRLADLDRSWSVSSAGSHATSGRPMHPYMVEALRARGIDATAFTSRRLTRDIVGDADLVLTAEASHRSAVVTLRPKALSRTFTLRQFAALAREVPPASPDLGGSELVALVRAARTTRLELGTDIADPYGRRRRAFRRCVDEIDRAVAAIVRPLAETA